MTEKTSRIFQIALRIRDVARVWSVLVFILALILVVGSRFGPPTNIQSETTLDYLIPVSLLISMIGLGIAWRREGWGALINILFYLAVVPLYWILHREWIHPSILVALSPVILPGVLFAIAWYLFRRENEDNL